jgi:antitoxin YefM
MQTTSLADFKAHLSEFAERAEREGERFTITRHGKPSVVLLSADDWESIEETLFWLSQPGIMEELAEADEAERKGDTIKSKSELMRRLGLA